MAHGVHLLYNSKHLQPVYQSINHSVKRVTHYVRRFDARQQTFVVQAFTFM